MKNEKTRDMAAETFGADPVLACDVASDSEIEACFAQSCCTLARGHWWGCTCHWFCPADQLDGDFTQVTTREGFAVPMILVATALWRLLKASRELLAKRQGSLLTLTYEGSIMCCQTTMSWV